jgi:adenosylhomocysteine nucleosidase
MSAPDSPLLIVTALPEELEALLDRAKPLRRLAAGSRPIWEGSLAGRPVVLARTGVGERNAREGMAGLVSRFAPPRWIGAGLAGALSPEPGPGDLVVAASVSDGDGTVVPPPDPAWAERALSCAPAARASRFFSARKIAGTIAEKAALRALHGGGSVAAVDMESAAWARAGSSVPYLLVRVVSDGAGEELPEIVLSAIYSDGGIDRSRILRRALRRPAAVGKLLALRRRAQLCARRLAEFLERFAAAGF